MRKYLRGINIVALSTLLSVAAINYLFVAFGVTSLLETIGLAAAFTAASWVSYIVLMVAICVPLDIKDPGMALITAIGTVGGAFGVWLVGALLPGVVLLSLPAIVLYAFINTMGVWVLAVLTNSLRQGLTMWPKR